MFRSLQQHGMRSLDEEFSQVFVSTAAGTGEFLLASCGVLAEHHSQPGSTPAALLEVCPVADGRDGGRSDHRSASGDRHQVPADAGSASFAVALNSCGLLPGVPGIFPGRILKTLHRALPLFACKTLHLD